MKIRIMAILIIVVVVVQLGRLVRWMSRVKTSLDVNVGNGWTRETNEKNSVSYLDERNNHSRLLSMAK